MKQNACKSILVIGLAAWAMSGVAGGFTAKPLGIFDARPGEREYHYSFRIWDTEFITGDSTFFGQLTGGRGYSWVAADGQVSRFGLGNPDGFANEIYRFETPSFAQRTDRGRIIAGSSTRRYSPDNAWVYDDTRAVVWHDGVNVIITPDWPQYVSASGYRGDHISGVSTSGLIFGSSNLYVGDRPVGSDAWVYDGSVFRFLRNSDPANPPPLTNPDGRTQHRAVGQLTGGLIVGDSFRRDGSTVLASTAWVLDGNRYTTIGLDGDGFEDVAGNRRSEVLTVDRDSVIGSSTRFNGDTPRGGTGWLYTGGKLRAAIEPTALGVGATVTIKAVLPDGRLLTSGRDFNTVNSDAFIDDGVTAISLAPNEARFTSPFGVRASDAYWSKGQTVVGMAHIPHPLSDGFLVSVGSAYWIHHEGQTRVPGLSDTLYVDRTYGVNGVDSYVAAINLAGDAVGTSATVGLPRPEPWPEGFAGYSRSGWFYDWQTNTTVPLVFSVTESGWRYTQTWDINDAGLVLGAYELYERNSSLGLIPFLWTLESGMVPLDSLVLHGLPHFHEGLSGSFMPDGTILLSGTPIGGGGNVSLLLSVPEPSTTLLAALPLLALRRRR
jgi:hypothetical protein